MAKRGPTPFLLGGTHGTVSFHVARRKTECRRWQNLLKGASKASSPVEEVCSLSPAVQAAFAMSD